MAINSLVISCYTTSNFVVAFKRLLAVIKKNKILSREWNEYDPLSVCGSIGD